MGEVARSPKPHKRVRWRQPAGTSRRPGVLDATRAELVRGLEQRQGQLWWRIARSAIVAGYPLAKAFERFRGLRSDGAASLLAMTVALLYCADIRTGFVGKPRQGGGRFERYTLRDLCQLAFGAQTEADLRRGRRALDVMTSLGWIFPTKQVRRHAGVTSDGVDAWRSEAAVRRVNLDRLTAMTGTSWLLSRDRQHADRVNPRRPSSIEDARQRREERSGASSSRGPALRRGEAPRATGDPPGGSGTPRSFAEILKLFDQG